ncbi:MAG: putative membrane protein, partial [Arenicella sp.]
WYTVAWTIVGAILIFAVVGYAIFALVWLWALYRLINGLVKIAADEAYPL